MWTVIQVNIYIYSPGVAFSQLRKILDSLPKTTFTIGTFLALKQVRISDVALEKSISLRLKLIDFKTT
jgi:hypothetical protein